MAVRSAEGLRPGGVLRSGSPTTTLLVAGGGAVALATARVLPSSSIEDGPVVCPFRLATGLPCPGCGLIRSWVYATHGQLADSLAANPFGVLVVLGTVVLIAVVVYRGVRRAPMPDLTRIRQSRLFWVGFALWMTFGVARLVAVLLGGHLA